MSNLAQGVQLLLIGMPVVFLGLALICLSGWVLQAWLMPLSEKWLPVPANPSASAPRRRTSPTTGPEVIAAVCMAVHQATDGRGQVVSIEQRESFRGIP